MVQFIGKPNRINRVCPPRCYLIISAACRAKPDSDPYAVGRLAAQPLREISAYAVFSLRHGPLPDLQRSIVVSVIEVAILLVAGIKPSFVLWIGSITSVESSSQIKVSLCYRVPHVYIGEVLRLLPEYLITLQLECLFACAGHFLFQ